MNIKPFENEIDEPIFTSVSEHVEHVENKANTTCPDEYVWNIAASSSSTTTQPNVRIIPSFTPNPDMKIYDEMIDCLYKPFKANEYCPTPLLKDIAPHTTILKPKFLYHKNPHVLDQRICKAEQPHKYFIDGSCEHTMSGTEFLHHFFPPFDSEGCAENTLNSKSHRDKKHRPSYKYFGCKSVADIQDKWNVSRDLGTDLHANIEAYFNNEPYTVCPENEQLFQYFLNLFNDKNWVNWEVFRTEWSIFDEESQICGQIDYAGLICKLFGETVLVDWKRCETISDYAFDRENMFGYGPCSDLKNTKFSQYALQQNLYKYILEKNYGLRVTKMFLVRLHPNCKDNLPQVIKLPELQSHIIAMMEHRKLALNKYRNVQQ